MRDFDLSATGEAGSLDLAHNNLAACVALVNSIKVYFSL